MCWRFEMIYNPGKAGRINKTAFWPGINPASSRREEAA
jgi:hypothetical protein